MSEREALPRQGPLPRPESLEEAREQLKTESFDAPRVQRVVLNAVEFTSICPRSGQPDFGEVVIEYEPRERCLESKALKHYLWAYRDEGAFCEALAARIADDVVYAIEPAFVQVKVVQSIRGGISVVATAERSAAA